MSRQVRTVVLTERRSAVRRLPRADVDDLARHFRHVVNVTPTFERGVYRLMARGYVGRFRTVNVRWEVRPKLPWESLRVLTGLVSGLGGQLIDNATFVGALADLLAGRLAALIRERADAGLLRDYAERQALEPAIRGRIDLPRQLRDTRTPSLFHLIADEFTPDVIWNRVPKAAARWLLDQSELGTEARTKLWNASRAFAGVSDVVPSLDELKHIHYDQRSEPYRPLLDFSSLILGQSVPTANPTESAVLINLEHLFQCHIGEILASPGALPDGWSVETQPNVVLTTSGPLLPITLRPDLVIYDSKGRPASVWDVKWKSLQSTGPDADDLHQALGYAAALGLRTAGLIYPGRRFALNTYTTTGTSIALRIVRLRLVGGAERCDRAAVRLARLVARSWQ